MNFKSVRRRISILFSIFFSLYLLLLSSIFAYLFYNGLQKNILHVEYIVIYGIWVVTGIRFFLREKDIYTTKKYVKIVEQIGYINVENVRKINNYEIECTIPDIRKKKIIIALKKSINNTDCNKIRFSNIQYLCLSKKNLVFC